jgi:hypothetical protein
MNTRSPLNWSWGLAGLLIANAVQTACGQNCLDLATKWQIAAGDTNYPYLSTNSNQPRGIMINRSTGHVLIPINTPAVYVLDGAHGSPLGTLDTNGVTGGTYPLILGGVADDGAIYVCDLTTGGTTPFKVYRWASETSIPTTAFNGTIVTGGTRCGDSFAVRGAGANTELIASGTGSPYVSIFTTADGLNFTARQFDLTTVGLLAGDAKRGLVFDGANNAFYCMSTDSLVAHHLAFDLAAGTLTSLGDISVSPTVSMISRGTIGGHDVMAAIVDNGYTTPTHLLEVFDMSDPSSPVLVDSVAFPTVGYQDINVTGATDIGAGMIVGLSTHAGVLALHAVTNAPAIVTQPQDHTGFTSGSVSFSVAATGSCELSYQWYFNGSTLLAGETSSTLTLHNIQAANAGNYSVTVSNIAGIVPSASAKLLVVAPPAGYPAAIVSDNPLAYWRLDEASGALARDVWGGHDGAYANATLGLPGYSLIDADTAIGLSRSLPGGVSVADNSAFNFTGSAPTFTLEGWVNFTDFQSVQRLFSDVDYSVVGSGSGIGFGVVDANTLRFTTYGVQDFDLALDGYGPLSPGQWYYLAGVADGAGNFIFYLNGQQVGVISFTGDAVGSTKPFCLGRSPNDIEAVNGQIDELAVYGTALTADQVLAHYNARYGVSTPPLIRRQPVAVTNYVSLNATFTVLAEGSGTLSYQWQQDNVDLPGQVSQTLTLSPLDLSSAGHYSVVITGVGSTNSAKAHLTVLPVPTAVDLSAGLVLHLKFDGDFLDYSGRGNHGTNVGATTFVTDGKTGSQAAHFTTDVASSLYNYVTLGLRPDLAFSSNVNFSVAYWVRLPAGQQPGDVPFLGNAVGAGNSPGYFFGPTYTTGGWRWTLENVDASYDLACPGAANSINDGNWHHVASTFNRTGNGITYLDGLEVSSVAIASVGDLDTHQPTVVGQDPTGTYVETATFDLNDLGVWRRVLTPLEAAAGVWTFSAGLGRLDRINPGGNGTDLPPGPHALGR